MAHREQRSFSFGQYRLFSLFGFEVKLDLSWLLLALLISWSLGAGVFPVDYPGLSKQVYSPSMAFAQLRKNISRDPQDPPKIFTTLAQSIPSSFSIYF